MTSSRAIRSLAALFLILTTACGPTTPLASTPPVLPTAAPTATAALLPETPLPSATPLPMVTTAPPTAEPTATQASIPTMPPYVGTPVPAAQLAPVSLTNYRDLRQVGRFSLDYENLQDGVGVGFNPEVVFSPDSRYLAYLDEERLVLWDLYGQKIARTFTVECCGLGPGIAFSPDSRFLATNGNEGPIVWDVGTGEMVSRGVAPVVDLTITDMRYLQDYNTLAFSADGSQVITGSYYASTSITFWDTRTGRILRETYPTWNGVNELAISSDGKTIYAAVRSGQLNAFDAATGELLEYSGDGVCTGSGDCSQTPYQVCLEGIGSVQVTSNGEILALQCQPKDTEFLPIECTDPENGFPLSDEYRRDICFSTKLFRTETWEFLGYLNEVTPAIAEITFNSDGGIVAQAVGHPIFQVKLWNTMTREEIHTLEGFPAEIVQAAFSPDGKLLLVQLKGGEVVLFGVMQ